MTKTRVAVLRGGPSSEYDVSMQTGAGVLRALGNLGYHVVDVTVSKAGEWIVANRRLPVADPFLQDGQAFPWVLHEWLFEVLLHAVHSMLGTFGVRLLVGAALMATAWILYSILRSRLREIPAALMMVLGVATQLSFAAPRPHLVSYVFLALYLRVLIRFADSKATGGIWWLPAMMVLWVNLHGGYALGIVLVGLFLTAQMIEGRLNSNAGRQYHRASLKLAICLVLCVLAAVINPYGIEHLRYPFDVMNLWLTPRIAEWQPPALTERATAAFFVATILYVLGQIYRRERPGAFDLIVPGAMIVLGLTAARHAALAGMVVAVFAARALVDGAMAQATRAVTRLMPRAAAGSGRHDYDLGAGEFFLNWIFVLGFAVAVAWSAPARDRQQMEEANTWLAWKAIDFIASKGIRARCFNEYGSGGYFTYRLWPHNKAFIDGRADLYPDEFAQRYVEAAGGEESWRTTFTSKGFDCVVLPRRVPLRQVLLINGLLCCLSDCRWYNPNAASGISLFN